MANKHIEKCLVSLLIKKVQIKRAIIYRYTLTKMVKILKTDNTKCSKGCRETRTLTHYR